MEKYILLSITRGAGQLFENRSDLFELRYNGPAGYGSFACCKDNQPGRQRIQVDCFYRFIVYLFFLLSASWNSFTLFIQKKICHNIQVL